MNKETLINNFLKNKRLTLNNDYRRPVSLSESFIYDIDEYIKNESEIKEEKVPQKEEKVYQKEEILHYETFHYTDRCEMIINKLMLFFIHLFLISMFEVVFFFNYVTKYEDKALIDIFNSLTNSVTNTCTNFNNQTKVIIDDIFNIFVNTTKINQDSLKAYDYRNMINHNLFINAILYFIGIALINILLFVINKIYYKRKINYKDILLDNMIMITILGIYEYIFFTNIVFRYITITPEEITKNEINNFLLNC
jgi:hypothetical protein